VIKVIRPSGFCTGDRHQHRNKIHAPVNQTYMTNFEQQLAGELRGKQTHQARVRTGGRLRRIPSLQKVSIDQLFQGNQTIKTLHVGDSIIDRRVAIRCSPSTSIAKPCRFQRNVSFHY
jgi:hypothetical protein